MKRPSIKTPCVADQFASTGERIAEIQFPDGGGCLISVRSVMGVNPVEVYRTTGTVAVCGNGDEIEVQESMG